MHQEKGEENLPALKIALINVSWKQMNLKKEKKSQININ